LRGTDHQIGANTDHSERATGLVMIQAYCCEMHF
jgi:hypothetical protein